MLFFSLISVLTITFQLEAFVLSPTIPENETDIYDQGLFEGDIELSSIEDHPLIVEQLEEALGARAAIVCSNCYWKNGDVPYAFRLNHYTLAQRQSILKSLNKLTSAVNNGLSSSCINVRVATDNEIKNSNVDKLLFNGQTQYCSSHVGKRVSGGWHTINLSSSGCMSERTIQHETMHAMGFRHEQSRPDRDNYVKIHWENIKTGKEHNFNKYSTYSTKTYGLAYGFDSIMHYFASAFSKNGLSTITRTDNGYSLGGRYLTNQDVQKIRKLYNCH
ncbi:hypothetical protein SNEBB_004345 [Seison nebaliae]|nr:hypothetical protein SNEBB_004345 [Seison nebaliae]